MKGRVLVLLAAVMAVALLLTPAQVARGEANIQGSEEYPLLWEFVTAYPRRVYGSAVMADVADYLAGKFSLFGISDVRKQAINDEGDCNVIARLDAENTEETIVIGAHYDAARDGEGASDNASGVVCLLSIARELAGKSLPFDVEFVLFTGEEEGLLGSKAYVEKMSEKDVESTLLMINLDTIASGDRLYVYCEDKSTSLLNAFLQNAQGGAELAAKPFAKGIYTALDVWGYGYWQMAQNSDHTPFRLRGIPTAFFFSGNYDGYDYRESADAGKRVINTSRDTLETLLRERDDFADKMRTVVQTTVATLTAADFPAVAHGAKSQLVSPLWHKRWIPVVICLALVACLVIFVIFLYKKWQKTARSAPPVAQEEKRIFQSPDAEEIFKF